MQHQLTRDSLGLKKRMEGSGTREDSAKGGFFLFFSDSVHNFIILSLIWRSLQGTGRECNQDHRAYDPCGFSKFFTLDSRMKPIVVITIFTIRIDIYLVVVVCKVSSKLLFWFKYECLIFPGA